MVKTSAIRIGDTLKREYRVYNPLAASQWANPNVPEADLTSPANLTEFTIAFHLNIGGILRAFTTAAGVTITPLTGLIAIELEKEQTALFKVDSQAESYVTFTDTTGNVTSKFQLREQVIRRETLV